MSPMSNEEKYVVAGVLTSLWYAAAMFKLSSELDPLFKQRSELLEKRAAEIIRPAIERLLK